MLISKMNIVKDFLGGLSFKFVILIAGVVLGAWLFKGCGTLKVPQIIRQKDTPKEQIDITEDLDKGETKVDTVYIDVIKYVDKPVPVDTFVDSENDNTTDTLPINLYIESIDNDKLFATLKMKTKGTLESWSIEGKSKEVIITRVDTLTRNIEITKLEPPKPLLLIGGGVSISGQTLRGAHVGGLWKLKNDKAIGYNYNLGVGDLPSSHQISVYFPIKPGEYWRNK